MRRVCPICGPKYSLCCIVISAWGILMLLLLGVAFYVKSSALLADIVYDHNEPNWLASADAGFHSAAYQCWIAVGLYVVTLVFSIWQYKMQDVYTRQ